MTPTTPLKGINMSEETPVEVVVKVKRNFRPIVKKVLAYTGAAAGFVLAGWALGKKTSTDSDETDTTFISDEPVELMNIETTDNQE
jgi:hypothetical protein